MQHILVGILLALGAGSTTPQDIMTPNLALMAQAIHDLRPTTTPELIEFWSAVYGVDGEKAKRIAMAESSMVATAKNPKSSATGIFQILKSTWSKFGCEGERINAEDNIICAVKIMETSGTHHWSESSGSWDK